MTCFGLESRSSSNLEKSDLGMVGRWFPENSTFVLGSGSATKARLRGFLELFQLRGEELRETMRFFSSTGWNSETHCCAGL